MGVWVLGFGILRTVSSHVTLDSAAETLSLCSVLGAFFVSEFLEQEGKFITSMSIGTTPFDWGGPVGQLWWEWTTPRSHNCCPLRKLGKPAL